MSLHNFDLVCETVLHKYPILVVRKDTAHVWKVVFKAEKPQVFKKLRQGIIQGRYSYFHTEHKLILQFCSLYFNDEDRLGFHFLGLLRLDTSPLNQVVWSLTALIRDLNFRTKRVFLILMLHV